MKRKFLPSYETRTMDLFSTTAKVAYLARSGLVKYARDLFDKMPERDTVAWNAMLTGYAQLGQAREALFLFTDMRISGTIPDPFTVTAVLSSSADSQDLSFGRKVHALVFSFGFQSSLPVCNSLVDMYGKCSCPSSASRVFGEMGKRNEVTWCSLLYGYVKLGYFEDARRLFDEIPSRKTIAWNILIGGCTRFKEHELCIGLFKEMQKFGFKGDLCTFSGLMNACTELEEPCSGCMIHASIIKSGWNSIVVVDNSILSFYAKFGRGDEALRIFSSMGTRTQVSWNAMIDSHMKDGDIGKALFVFQRAPETNAVSWTAMIGGYTRNGDGEQAIAVFAEMIRTHLQPDEFTFGAVLHACANLAVLGLGRMVHGFVILHGFGSYLYTGNGLLNMYAKCGDIDGSIQVFNGIPSRDLVSWNAMLFGFAVHGWVSNVSSVYEEMLMNGVSPDKVTFIGLLMACSHSGLIEQGLKFFKTMQTVYGIQPDADHVVCIVDMLGRAGHLEEASVLLEEFMKITGQRAPNSGAVLLGACTVYGNVGIGKKVGEELVAMESRKDVGYVMLSNLYCASGEWKEAEKVRKAMAEQGVKKVPGCSWIEVRRNMAMVFASGDNHSFPCAKSVSEVLAFLEAEMRNPSFFVVGYLH